MQAARGTPVGHAPRRRLLFLLVALTAYVADQVSKILAVDRLEDRPDVRVIGDLLQLHLTFNAGAAFSAGTSFTPVITVIAVLATVAVLYFARRAATATWAVALGLLLAGVTGNLTDRLLREPGPMRGHVVDFLQLPHWPIFNIADICINAAAVLIVVQALRGVRLDGTRDVRGATDADIETATSETGEAGDTDSTTDHDDTGDTGVVTDAPHRKGAE